MHKVTNQLALF